MNDNKRKLYDALSEEYDLGSFEQFSADIDSEEKRRKLYDATAEEYDYGSYDSFSSQLGYPAMTTPIESAQSSLAEENQIEPLRGFKAGAREGWKGLKAGTQFAYGEVANALFGSSDNDANALYKLDEMLREGKDVNAEVEGAWTDAGRELRTGALEFLPNIGFRKFKERVRDEAERQRVLDDIREVIGEAGGDISKARELLATRAQEKSYGDIQKEKAKEKFADIQETDGFGAWVGENAVQMIPSASALIVGALTKSPGAARAIGMIGMGGMTAATAGSSMYEAREAGASDYETRKVGVIDGALEYITEKLPFDNYTNWMMGKAKSKVTTNLAKALRSGNVPLKSELEELLKAANKELGGKLFSKKNLSEYIADMIAEGASEFTAEASQTMTKLIYDNPDVFPLLGEAVSNGMHGALAGFFMGGVLGGASTAMEHQQHKQRRKEQGHVDIGVVDFGDGQNEIVEILSVDEDTQRATVLHNGAVEYVDKNAVGQSYRYSYEAFEAGRMKVQESEAIDNNNVTEGQIKASADRMNAATTALTDALRAAGTSEEDILTIIESEQSQIFESDEVQKAYEEYVDARNRARELTSAYNKQMDTQRGAKRLDIEEAVGEQFWRDIPTENAEGVTTWETLVTHATLQDGRKVYLFPGIDATETAGVTEDGQKVFVTPDMLVEGSEVTESLDVYLDNLISDEKKATEQERMSKQTLERTNEAKVAAQPGSQVNIGTAEEPVVGTIVQTTPDGVIVESEAGASQLSWEEYANAMSIGSAALTDEENASLEASEILSAESSYKAQQTTDPAEAENAVIEGAEAQTQAKAANIIPVKADGSVDQTTLWNQDPERWAQWNDEQRQDGGANSLAYITTAIKKESAALAKKEKAYNELSDFAARDQIEQDIKKSRERLARLAALQQKYAPVEEVATDVEASVQTAPTEAVPTEAEARSQRVMDTISSLYNDESLSESEIEDYIAANVAGSQDDLDKHIAKAPKMGRDLDKYKADKEAHDAKTAELTAERDFWKEVQDYNTIPEIEMDMEPQNALEFTANELARKDGIKLQRDSFIRHTGYGSEAGNFLSLLRTKKNGGLTLEEAGERLMEMDRENDTGFFDQSDPNAGLNAILDVLGGAKTSGDVSGYIKANREQMAREAVSAARNAMAEQMAQPEAVAEIASELEEDLPEDIFPDVAPLDEDMPDFETRLRTGQSSEDSGRFAEIKERAAAWAKRLGIKVNVLESIDQVEDAIARDAISRGVSAPGWFNPKTGEVYIYAPHNPNLSEVDKTMIHEVISHKGLRGLLGKKAFNALCDSVWNLMDAKTKAKYLTYENVLSKARLAQYKANPDAFVPTAKERRAAADEFIAGYSESVNTDKNAWQKMIDSAKRFINKLTGKYTLGDQLDELIEASLARYEQIAKMELKGVVEEGATYRGVMDAETGAMINPSANEQAEGNTALRAKDGTLVGMHNISEDKLRKAIKQGGLANPSTAVVNIAEYSLEGYGDISLIMPSSLVDSETGDNVGTYTGDAWTPTYPTISRQVDDAGWKIIKDRIRAAVGESDALYHDIVNSVDNYLSDDRNSRLEFVFLKEKGIEPKIEMKGADGYVGLRNLEAILGVEGLRDSMESYEKYKAASPMAKRSFNMWQRVGGDKKAHKALKDEIRQYPQFAKLMGLDEDLTFAGFDSFTYSIFRKEYDAGNVNTIDTLGGASRYVDANDMRTEFDAWLESLMEEAGAKEVFFAGWTRDGDRIYKDNTLENVSRHMRMQGRTNAYNDHGLSATKSALLQRLTSLAEIRKNRARLQDESSYNRAYDKLKDRLFSVISQLADMEKISDNPFMNIDYAEARLQEAIVKRNPISYLNKEYGYSIDPKGEYAEELKSFIKDVQKMPAKYFETKFERPVYLNEFAAAVMPNNTSEDVKQAITEAGLPIFEYDSAVEGARREATLKATEEEGVRFRILGEMGAANLDAAEEATTRLDNLDVARQMEEAGKDAKTIKLATGWERGVDNLWRYEVPDEYDLTNLEKRLQEELDNGAAKTWGIVYPSDLGQLLKEYPDFNVDILVWVGDEFENTGAYSPATEGDENTFGRSASIEVEAKTIADVAPLLAHEIQHAIQEMEGFAEGGQARGLNDKLSAELDKRVATIKQLREEGRNEEADELMQKSKGLAEAVINNEDDAYGNYKKLAGEVEARNAAKRIGKSLQERRESLLSETEDVAREDQIILMENLGVNHMADGNGGVRLTSSNASIARFDKVNGTDVRGFIDFLKNDKEFVAGKPTVFHIANAGDLLGQFGIKGKFMVGQFTFSRTHTVNSDHDLGVKEWIDVINNLNNPIAITSYKGQPNQFRIYTYATINGRNICVGVNVSTKDGSIELANIISAYGRDIQNLLGNESVFLLYPSTIQELKQKISQVSTAHNSLLNATSSALSADKGSNNLGESNTRFRISNENQAIFVSNAARAVEGIKQEKATPEQWLKMIEKAGGLKAGEDKWMGLSDWLKASDKKTLTKQEVLDFINENMIIIEEQHYEEDAPDEEALWYEYEESEEGIEEINYQMQLDAENHAELALAGRDLTDEEWEEEYDRLVSDYIEDDLFGSARSAAKDAVRERWMEEEAPKIMEGRPREINATRLEYTTNGLINLHEIALTVPTIESWNEGDTLHFGDAGEGRAVAWIRFGEASKWEKENREDGKRGRTKFVLVIDEIQSKRHQERRDIEEKVKKFEKVRDEKKALLDEYATLIDNKVASDQLPTEQERAEFDKRKYEWEKAVNNYNKTKERSDAVIENMDAPFDKNWHELAMKRMLRYAAENDYDYIAWTKGEQQAERYGIGNAVSRIESGNAEGFSGTKKIVDIYAPNGVLSSTLYVNEDGKVVSGDYLGQSLSDIVGKEMAVKLMADGEVVIDGDNLRIGGEGMKGFYDRMLPAFMNKYGKKWGVKVEDINFPGLEGGLTMHSVPVTEEMKSSVMEGQVMFRVRGENESAEDFFGSIVNEYQKKFNAVVPIETINPESKEELSRYAGIPIDEISDEDVEFIKNEIETANNWGGYSSDANKVAIFVRESIKDGKKVELVLIHENIHAINDKDSDVLALGEYLWNKAEEGTKEYRYKTEIQKRYPQDRWYNEMSAYVVSEHIQNNTLADLEYILDLENINRLNKLLNTIGYGKERAAEASRRSGNVLRQRLVGWLDKAAKKRQAAKAELTAEERRIINEYFPGAFPEEDSDIRFRTSLELDEEFGDAWRNQQNEDGRHSTQVANTKSTYEKIGRYLEDAGMKGASILDASSGLGLGTQALREMGFKVDDVEPFPSENREAPTFSSYADIDGKYDVVISNAVLNVIPDDWRADVLHQMADAVKEGGKMIINTRPASNIAQQGIEGKTRITLDSPSEILVKRGDRIAAYQKGFTSEELAQWIESELGEGWRVEKATKKNSGISGEGTAVVIKESDGTRFRVTGTPTEDIVAEGVSLSPAQLASLAGDIFAALPEDSRKKITDGLNGNILGLQDAILQIPTSLAVKEEWNDEDRQMAEVVAEQMTKAVGIEMTRPFSASEALWTLYNAVNKSTDLVSEASRALVRRNLGFDPQTLEMEKEARDGVRFRTVGNASANAQASMYNRGAANVWTRLKESFVDMHASVEKLVKAIEKKSGKVAQGFENVLMALNQQSSKGLAAMEAYEQKFLNKMFDEIRKIMDKTDFKYEDIVRYVILKHGLERNEKLAQRDAKAHYQEIYDDIISKIKGMNPAQKRTYLTNAQLRDADAKAELARLQGVNTSTLTPDQLNDHKKELAKAKKEATEAAEHLARAQKIATMTEQDALDELDKTFKKIEKGTDSVYKEMRKNDYSGISSMFYDTLGVDRKNYATEEEYQAALMQAKADKYDNLGDIEGAAQMEVTLFENAVNTDNLWKSINRATKETLRQQYEANMISKDQYLNLRDMFEFYVPLRGFKDNTAEDMYTYYRRPNSTGYTKPILGAEGRKTEAESPFGWIAAMAGSAIASNVKNEAKLALYYFVANRPDNGIATLSRTWFVHTPGDVDANGKKIFRPAYPPFNEDLSSASAKADYEIWQANMRDLQKQGLAYEAGQRLNLGNSVVNISDTNKPEHIVNVKVGGKDYTIVINGNPRAAQAINGDLNIEATAQDYSSIFGPMLRWMSSVNTSYNPEFWITNMMRDVAFTMMAVNIKEDPAYRRKFFKNWAKAFKVISMVAKNEKGTLGNKYIENMYKDFVKYGGVTGYTQIKDSETWEKEIENYLASNDPSSLRNGKIMRGMKSFLHGAHRFGESLEQVSRFAAFLTAVETGKSINEAINDAKEITVNFNRKGSGKMITLEEAKYLTDKNGQPLNKLEQWAAVGLSSIAPLGRRFIMFFNAAIQGLNATYKLYAKNKTRAIGWALGYAAVGMINAVLHAMLDDDDDYLDIPQYERRNSLMIGWNGAYIKWALPQEARAFYALGDLAVESVMGRNPHQSVIGEALKISTEILPVNPSEGWKAFMPSVAIPLVELALNEDYKGAPIYNEQKWLTEEEKKRSTKWSKAYSGTGDLYIGIAKVLNAVTGGDEHDAGLVNLQPEKMEHIVQSAFGGTIRTADKFINTIMAAIDPEEDVTVRQTPFLNRFLTINDERYKNVHVNDVYDYYAAEAEHVTSLQKQYTKDRNSDALKDLRSSEEYKWARIYSKYKKPIKKYQEAIRAADTTKERMELMKQQDELKRKMIKEISEL